MSADEVSERSFAPLTDDHLRRLAAIAQADRDDLFARKPHLEVFRSRIVMTVLCQGAALHRVNGRNGVKDFDIYSFYAKHPDQSFPFRRRKMLDFGTSEFGRHPVDRGFKGRHVDLMGRELDVPTDADSVAAVRDYLRGQRTGTAWYLSQKAMVALEPNELFGAVVWPLAG